MSYIITELSSVDYQQTINWVSSQVSEDNLLRDVDFLKYAK